MNQRAIYRQVYDLPDAAEFLDNLVGNPMLGVDNEIVQGIQHFQVGFDSEVGFWVIAIVNTKIDI